MTLLLRASAVVLTLSILASAGAARAEHAGSGRPDASVRSEYSWGSPAPPLVVASWSRESGRHILSADGRNAAGSSTTIRASARLADLTGSKELCIRHAYRVRGSDPVTADGSFAFRIDIVRADGSRRRLWDVDRDYLVANAAQEQSSGTTHSVVEKYVHPPLRHPLRPGDLVLVRAVDRLEGSLDRYRDRLSFRPGRCAGVPRPATPPPSSRHEIERYGR